MSARWFWKRKDDLVGPLSTAELHDHLRKHRVRETDAFRVEGTDDWLSAAEITALFQAEEASAAARSAADALAANRHRPPQSAGDAVSRGGLAVLVRKVGYGIAAVWSRVCDVAGSIIPGRGDTPTITSGPPRRWRWTGGVRFASPSEWLAEAYDFIKAALSRSVEAVAAFVAHPLQHLPPRAAKILLAVLATTLLVALFKDVRFDRRQNEDVYAELTTAHKTLTALHRGNAPQAEREQFAAATLAWLEPRLDELTKRARAMPVNRGYFWRSDHMMAQARRELLCAADCLARSLKGQSGGGYFEIHMQNAHAFLTDTVRHPVSRYGPRPPPRTDPGYALPFDVKTAAFVAFDAMFVVAGLSYWLWRRNNAFW